MVQNSNQRGLVRSFKLLQQEPIQGGKKPSASFLHPRTVPNLSLESQSSVWCYGETHRSQSVSLLHSNWKVSLWVLMWEDPTVNISRQSSGPRANSQEASMRKHKQCLCRGFAELWALRKGERLFLRPTHSCPVCTESQFVQEGADGLFLTSKQPSDGCFAQS